MASKKDATDAKVPSYNVKLEAVEAFVLCQLVDESTIKGANARKIVKLRDKLQKVLDTHHEKAGEYVGYAAPPGTSPMGANGA